MISHRRCLMLPAAIALTLAAGCAKVIETKPYEPPALGYAPTCRTNLGAYYLPRALLSLSVTVAADAGNNGRLSATFANLTSNVTADRAQPLCMDYLASPTSDDIVTVNRSNIGLLIGVTSNVTDKTPQIADKIFETAENIAVAVGRETVVEAQIDDRLDLQFDPFVWDELMTAKTALRRFGYCLYVEGHSFPVQGLSATGVRLAAERWCNVPQPPRYENPSEAFSQLPVAPEVMSYGILYRPNVAYKIVILRKRDPGGRDPWVLYQTRQIEMPNVSPILAIGVERAVFTNRTTTIAFKDGVLTDVKIDKKSELEAFAGIPLSLAKAIVDVPAQIVKFRYEDVNNQAALLDAQGKLIQAVTSYRNLVTATSGSTAAVDAGQPLSATVRTGQFAGGCVNAGGTATTCIDMARSATR